MPAFHPLANLFPLIEGEAFAELVADIAARGQEDAIVLHQGMILDGRNRFRACEAAGVEPRFTIFGLAAEPPAFMVRAALAGEALTEHQMRLTPVDLGDLPADFTVAGVPGADALGYVISKNLRRRHLDESQRALVAGRIANLGPGRPAVAADEDVDARVKPGHDGGEGQDAPGHEGATDGVKPANLPGLAQAEAAELLNVSERSVRSAKAVLDHGAPELVAAVERGEIAVSAAADLSTLSLEEQRRVIETADRRAIGAVAKAAREERQEEKRRAREARERGLAQRQRGLPDKRYGVIYADPEWRFEPYSRGTGMDRAAENHYPTSETNDIVLRPVGDIAAKDCVLFLWATGPMLPAALRVMAVWGFAYKSQVIWRKDRPGTGYWFRNEHELLLVGTRGEIPAPAMGAQWASVIDAPVGDHSAKPEVFAKMIEDYFPNLPKIELNARRARPGWDVWGLEAPESDEIPAGSPVPDAGQPDQPAASAAGPARRRKDAGPEGNHRPLSGAGPKPSAVASADGPPSSGPPFRPGSLLRVERGSGPDGSFVLVEINGPDAEGRFSLVLDNPGIKNPKPSAWINELTWDGADALVGAHGYCITEEGFSEQVAAVLAKRAARGEHGRFSIFGDCDATDSELMVMARHEASGAIAWKPHADGDHYATVAWLADGTFESPSRGTHHGAYPEGATNGIASLSRRQGSVSIFGYHTDGVGFHGSTMPIGKVRAFLRAWGKVA